MMDYLTGPLLIVAPWLFRFARGGPETWIPVAMGIGVIAYSLLTDYELGLFGLIPVPVHLGMDALGGAFLLASPWLFGYAGTIWWPHVVVGAMEIGAALLTRTVPERSAGTAGGGIGTA